MFDSYVKVRKSEIKELEKTLDETLVSIKEMYSDVDKLKIENEVLKKENAYLKELVDRLTRIPQTPMPMNPWEQGMPTWPVKSPYSMDTGCQVCGLKGVTGYVCSRQDCPSSISCQTK